MMTSMPILSALASFAAVILLIVIVGRVVRASGGVRRGAASNRRLCITETLAIDPKRRLVLLECDGRSVLLLTGMQDQVIGWLPESVS